MERIIGEGLTFDDVLLLPAYSKIVPSATNLEAQLTESIRLNAPVLSAAMDTVTEAPLAIALAQEGGIGVIHKNMPALDQAAHVKRVKKYESVVVSNPITIKSSATIADLRRIKDKESISGVPVVEGDGSLVGIVTDRDIRYADNPDRLISTVMIPKDKLVTADPEDSHDKIRALLHEHRIEKVLLVDKQFALKGIITARDLRRSQEFPYACKDAEGRLRVAAAIGVSEEDEQRAALLVEAGTDALTVDTAHGHAENVIRCVKRMHQQHPDVAIIAGNVGTADAAVALADAGAHVVKVGIGPGSICTTRVVTGVGVPQLTAIFNVAAALKKRKVSVIADGGIRYSGDVSKALAAGASAVMMGSMFAGTDEAPGDMELYEGRVYKSYRGMGSIGAMSSAHGSSDRYGQDLSAGREKLVPEGVEGRVPHRGQLSAVVAQLMGGLRSSMGYLGCATIDALQREARFVRLTASSVREGHVHDVDIVREPPNYPRN